MIGSPRKISEIPWYRAVIAFRAFGAALTVFLLHALEPLGTPPLVVAISGVLGVLFGSRLAHSRLTSLGFILGGIGVAATFSIAFGALNFALSAITPHYFTISKIQLHAQMCLIALTTTAAATWIFWRVRGAITLEAILLATISIVIFSGHRDYHFDRPKIINSVAWRLGIPHLSMLIVIGTTVLGAILCYLYFASQAVRPRADRTRIQFSKGRRNIWIAPLILTLLGLAVYVVQFGIYQHYNSAMLARVSNGVGMGESMGVSPLSFQSALGSTNQPAGLIRLEGDYADNPFTPMLYLRESALSQFNGKEMVFAGRAFDTDLPVTSPRDTYTGKEDSELAPRTPLVQSIYLLADHDAAFAVDYPLSIVQLKNPNPSRFRSSYRAYSIAPAFPLSSLKNLAVGDPRWSGEVRAHYLEQHSDTRYKDLAIEVTRDAASPVEKVQAITNYLSRTAIYTLTPNHSIKPTEDPVAPFLFGDHRGYCVHFAHAITYMLRALNIPARIGTGYLTDLSQAKDGHILLRMSDRHAWAEAYIQGTGWVPFDVQPDQVESHADTQVDTKLLEELMGNLEPGEEILPTDLTKNEPGMEDPDSNWIPNTRALQVIILLLILAMICVKLILRFAWRLAGTPSAKAKWGYISVASALYDQGFARAFGETREEFSRRSPNQVILQLSRYLNSVTYAPAPLLTANEVAEEIQRAHSALRPHKFWKRLLAAMNPASVMNTVGGGTW